MTPVPSSEGGSVLRFTSFNCGTSQVSAAARLSWVTASFPVGSSFGEGSVSLESGKKCITNNVIYRWNVKV